MTDWQIDWTRRTYSQQDVDDMIDANRAVSFRWGVLVGMIVSPCLLALGVFVAWVVRL